MASGTFVEWLPVLQASIIESATSAEVFPTLVLIRPEDESEPKGGEARAGSWESPLPFVLLLHEVATPVTDHRKEVGGVPAQRLNTESATMCRGTPGPPATSARAAATDFPGENV